jgi:hypothetical protein
VRAVAFAARRRAAGVSTANRKRRLGSYGSVGRGLVGHQAVFGDAADDSVVLVHHGQSTDPVVGEQPGHFLERGP